MEIVNQNLNQLDDNLIIDKQPPLKKQSNTRLAGLDGVRAMACFAVLIHHMAQRMPMRGQPEWIRDIQAFLIQGNTGVSLFFVLSGFLLSYPFWKSYLDGNGYPNIKQYALRRAARIMPGYYLAFFTAVLLQYIYNVRVEEFWPRFIAGLTFTSGFHYVTFFPTETNTPLWSVSFEIFSYILMPLFMFGLFKLFGKKRSFGSAIIFWLGSFALILMANHFIHVFLTPDNINRDWKFGNIGGAKLWMPGYNPIGFFGHFSIGIFAAGITENLLRNPEKLHRFKKAYGFDIVGVVCLICAISFLWFMRKVPVFGLQNQPYFFPIYAMLMGSVLISAVCSNWLGKILDNIFFRYTAKISFGIYIWHYMLIFVAYRIFTHKNGFANNLQTWFIITIGIIGASYIIATLSYYLIEKPILNWSYKKKFNQNI